MTWFNWRRWLKASSQPAGKTLNWKASRQQRLQLALEELEVRLAPATYVWDGKPDNGGASADNRWSTGTNWVGDVAPPPNAFADLVFPNGAVQLTNTNDFNNASFDQIVFSGGGYSESGNSLTLGNSTAGTGYLIHNAGTATDTINFNIKMGGAAGNKQFFTVTTSGGNLDIKGTISGNTGVELSKDGNGTLTLEGNNSGFTGPITVVAGALQITNNQALGTGSTTTVATNAQLQVNNVTGAINEALKLNGPGLSNDGALLSVAGSTPMNVWTGNIELDSDTTFGAYQGTSLTINGVISDLGAGHNVTKEMPGQVIFDPLNNSAGNTYRGNTTINAGTLTIRHSHALGTGAGIAVVNSSSLESGTLDLEYVANANRIDPYANAAGDGFSVPDEKLTINGPGREGLDQLFWTVSGALHNQAGNNSWEQNVTLWTSPSSVPNPFLSFAYNHVSIGAEGSSTLTLNGQVLDNAGGNPYQFDKVRTGTLVLTHANTYTGSTEVVQGALNIRDSQALGATPGVSVLDITTPAALELQTDALLDSVNTNSTNMTINVPLFLNGPGINNTGALHNLVGVNTWTGPITLAANTSIGVEPDPDPTNAGGLTYNDFSQLTVSGVISGFGSLSKVDLGELVLTAANTYTNQTFIKQGWITITNNSALGATTNGRTTLPETTVSDGAALHLKATTGNNLTIGENLTLSGLGITSANTINSNLWGGPNGTGLGALVNLSGDNVINGNILLLADATTDPGIGAETAPIANAAATSPLSQLTLTGWLEETLPVGTTPSGFIKLGTQRLIIQGPGYYTGNVDVRQGVLRVQNSTALGSDRTVNGSPTKTTVESGAALEIMEAVSTENGGLQAGLEIGRLETLILSGTGNNTTPSGQVDTLSVIPPTASMTADAGGDQLIRGPITLKTDPTAPQVRISVPTNARLSLLGNIDDLSSTNPAGGGIIFEGGGQLVLGGTNTYRGEVDVNAGVLNVQNSQALGSTAGGTVVASNASLELQGNISIGGEPLTIQGTGGATPEQITPNWEAVGPAPIVGGQTPGTMPVAGRVTGIVVDPQDSNVIYVTAAGGGAWRTRNGGLTWQQLTDNVPGATYQDLFTGTIAMAPTNPNVLYMGTGEADNSGDSYYGRGILKSTDAGTTWTLFQGNPANKELNGRTISRIVVDPTNPNIVYVAVSGNGVNGQTGNAGIWMGNTLTNVWVNLTAGKTATDAAVTFSPNDDYTDLAVVPDPFQGGNRLLFMAVGTADGSNGYNHVYISLDNGSTWTENNSTGFPLIDTSNNQPHSGVIKLSVSPTSGGSTVTVYAAIAYPSFYPGNLGDQFREIQVDTVTWSGTAWTINTWAATKAQPGPDLAGLFPAAQGSYDLPILVNPTNANIVYVAGVGQNETSGPWMSTDGGATWTDIGIGADNNGPHVDYHALTVDSSGRLYVGNDGGIWRLNGTAPLNWSDLNGSLDITQFYGVAISPTDPNLAWGGSQDNGTEMYNGDPAWTWVDAGDGGLIHVNSSNPNIVYHELNGLLFKSTTGGTLGSWVQIPPAPESLSSVTFPSFPFVIDPLNPNRLVVYASVFSTYGSTDVWESNDQGNTWHELDSKTPPQIQSQVTAIGLAGYQGPFVPDAGFPTVTDQGANTYVPDTVYVATDNSTGSDGVWVTKDHGNTWLARSTGLPVNTSFNDIAVDPNNRDVAYVVANGAGTGNGKVFKTTNAGLSWTDITGSGSSGLPDLPTWKVVIDPRSGDVYVGDDNGVYLLSKGQGNVWHRFGTNMPNVQVTDLELNTTLNMLTASTYGRGMFQIYLDAPPPVGATNGAVRGVSGSAVWTGPVTLVANTTLRSEAGATVTFSGTITGNFDITKVGAGTVILAGNNNPSYGGTTYVDDGVLAVRNPNALGTTDKPTIVKADPVASPGAVAASLELQSDLTGENLTLYGNGQQFNDHNTGALRNVSNFNTYSGGTITLGSDATIGVDSGSQLTINAVITDGGNNYSLSKELTGTLVLEGADSYGGTTEISQGILDVRNSQALGTGAGPVVVRDGAQLMLDEDLLGNNITVSGLTLQLSGSGITNTGALLNNSGNNTWQGPVSLQSIPALTPNPPPTPSVNVAMGAASGTTLTINGAVSESNGSFGLTKVGTGTIVLAQSDSYSGLTTVSAGSLSIQNVGGLGTTANGTVVNAGASLQLDLDPTNTGTLRTITGETLQLNGSGVGGFGALENLSGKNTWTGAPITLNTSSTIGVTTSDVQTVTLGGSATGTFTLGFNGKDTNPLPYTTTASELASALNGLSTIMGVGGYVIVTKTGSVFTVTFAGGLDGSDQPQMTVDGVAGGTTAVVATLKNGNPGSLTVSGGVQGALSSTLTKVGDGTLTFPTANSYAGLTQVQAGILSVGDPSALGGPTVAEVQTVTLGGSAAGTFTLTFNGKTTGSLAYTSTAAQVATALNNLSTIGGVGGSVSVTQNLNVYTITFGGNLAGFDQPQITATGASGTTATYSTVTNGSGGTSIAEVQTVLVGGSASGSFTLEFNNQTATLSYGATAAQVASALNNLSSISGVGGLVSVIQSGNLYTITFGGSLAGFNLPPLTANGTGGTTAAVSTITDGTGGTVVSSGATLQVQGGITVSSEAVVLNGLGYNNGSTTAGALQGVNGHNTWSKLLLLNSSSAIGAGGGSDTLTLTQPISDSGNAYGVTEVGTGSLDYQSYNAYTGVTQVNSGTLLLDVSAANNTTVLGTLIVGDGVAANGNAKAQWKFASQLPTTDTVTVNSDGLMDLHDLSQTLNSLVIVDGKAQTGTSSTGMLTLSSLNMTGGTLATGTTGSQVILTGSLTGSLTATSSATQTATITTATSKSATGGSLNLPSNPTITVNRPASPAMPVDLDVVAQINVSGSSGLTKTGNGILQIDANNNSSSYGATTVTGGNLQVDGVIGNVSLAATNSGSAALSGNGDGITTGIVGNVSVTTTNTNIVSPGDGSTPGTLHTGSLTLNSNSTFSANLSKNNSSLLVASGLVSLNGATLAGSYPAPSSPNAVTVGTGPYTIIKVGVPPGLDNSSQFAQGTSGFVSGLKFGITYDTTDNPNLVTLAPELMNASLVLSASPTNTQTATNPPAGTSVYGQSITYVATVTPETGASASMQGDTVDFWFDGGSPVSATITWNATTNTGTATFVPTASQLSVGTHTILAQFLGDGSYNATPDPTVSPNSGTNHESYSQTVAQAATQVDISDNSPVYGQTATLVAVISAKSPGAGNPSAPGGTVTFTVDGNVVGTKPLVPGGVAGNATGTATLSLSGLSVGAHNVHISYSGDSNFLGIDPSSNHSFTVGKADFTITVTAPSPATTPIYGQSVTLQATLAAKSPGSLVPPNSPAEVVTFLEGNTFLGSGQIINGVAQATVSNLSAGSHTITAQYTTDNNFNTETGTLNLTVNQASTYVTIQSSAPTSAVGQSVTFTATVNVQLPGTGTPQGTVTFTVDSIPQSPVTVNGSGQATLTVSNFTFGSHTITAKYNGNDASGNFAASPTATMSPNQQVLNGVSTTLTSSVNPAVFGQSVTFTATVTATSGSGTPGGQVTFVVDGVNQPPTNLSGGKATLTISTFTAGTHAVSVNYDGDNTGGFAPESASASPNTMSVSETVNAASTGITVGASTGSSVYGQPVTFTATVSTVPPGSGTPSGSVTFVIDGVNQPAVALNGAGQASLTLNTLAAGSHTISATFGGSANFAASGPASSVGEAVAQASVSMTVTTSSSTLSLGQPTTFTATVTANSPSATTPTGTVTFIIDGVSQTPISLNGSGQAVFTISTLPRGPHTITATYNGGGNFVSITSPVAITVNGAPVQFFTVISNFSGSPNQVWINEVYLDLLNRPADPLGLSYWSDQIEEFGVSRQSVLQSIVTSDEYRTDFINKLYNDLFGRTPILPEVQYQLGVLRGGMTDEQLTAAFLSAQEYFLRYGLMDNGVFTNAVYQYVLGRPASQSDLQYWGNFLLTGSRYDMALQILQSPERLGDFVRQQYVKLLGREPDGSPNFWFVQMEQGATDEQVIIGLAASDEYFMRLAPLHNTQAQEQAWINQLYLDLLGHPVDAGGEAFWVNLQEHGVPRLNITQSITNSTEYRTRVIVGLFQTMLNRTPSSNDVSVYLNYLQQGGTDESMKAMILGSAEYYFDRGSGTPFGFLNAVYHDVLDQPLDNSGIAYWGGKLAAGEDRTALAYEMVTSFDADEVVVQNYYLETLKRSADAAGLAYWASLINGGTPDENALAQLAATDEYYRRATGG